MPIVACEVFVDVVVAVIVDAVVIAAAVCAAEQVAVVLCYNNHDHPMDCCEM